MAGGRRCVFCGAPRVSKEHAIPRWVRRAFPPLRQGQQIEHKIQVSALERRFERDSFELTVKRVCRNCNHGWMEQAIERPNQSILRPMFLGAAKALTPTEQQHVATWTIKTHLMVQYRDKPFRAAPPEQLRWLYERRTPPPKCKLWLAAFAGALPHLVSCRTHVAELSTADPEIEARKILRVETMTLCIGHLVLQSFKWSGPEDQLALALPDRMLPFVQPLWPPEREQVVRWPPPYALDNAESLDEFSDQWTYTGPMPNGPVSPSP